MIGLTLIGIGTGGIKPCVASFGGDQFQLPQQERQLSSYFSIFYFAINAGSLISTFITPIFRRDIGCFGDETCYPLAFGVPAVLMIVSIIVFVSGKPFYKIRKPEGNVLSSVFKTITYALSRKRQSKEKKEHFLDHASDKYSKREIEDIKILLRVLVLYIPVPLFWALFDQQGSRWTFQASRMNGDLGGFVLKPDQFQVVNPVLILAMIPVFDQGVYPLLAKVGILKKPLQRLTVGGVFAAIAFIISGLVELQLYKTYPVELSSGQSHLHFVNMAPMNLTGQLYSSPGDNPVGSPFELPSNDNYILGVLDEGNYTAKFAGYKDEMTFQLFNEEASTILITGDTQGIQFTLPTASNKDSETGAGDTLEKTSEGNPYIRVIQFGLWHEPTSGDIIESNAFWKVALDEKKKSKKYYEFEYESNETIYSDWRSTPVQEVEINEYRVLLGNGSYELDDTIKLELGGSYILTIVAEDRENGKFRHQLNVLTKPNSMHMFWLLPQYFILTCGEIMFSITIMDFSYAEAPKSMKSVMQSAWLLTVAFGNLIDAVIAALQLFDQQWKEFFLFAGLMLLDMMIFAYMAYRYKPAELGDVNGNEVAVEPADKKDEDNEDEKNR
ncbi:unnamed protein product [Allacma fusca]|uniref:Uncharacterized protein n=1 Tax=Allacma fusca TaxID=39272 RepID=A0A8J2JSC7_9HEXA|nr:unnamed protein product [Allacma fusca]